MHGPPDCAAKTMGHAVRPPVLPATVCRTLSLLRARQLETAITRKASAPGRLPFGNRDLRGNRFDKVTGEPFPRSSPTSGAFAAKRSLFPTGARSLSIFGRRAKALFSYPFSVLRRSMVTMYKNARPALLPSERLRRIKSARRKRELGRWPYTAILGDTGSPVPGMRDRPAEKRARAFSRRLRPRDGDSETRVKTISQRSVFLREKLGNPAVEGQAAT